MHVGFVGTGNMGRPMATNILKAGHRLTVWDLSAEATAPLEKSGAVRATDLPALAREVGVTLTSLPNDSIVEAVIFGEQGRPGLMAGALFVVVLGLGEFFTERVIGGAQNPMLAGLILRQIDIFQWASASAIAVMLTVVTLITVFAMLRFFDLRKV